MRAIVQEAIGGCDVLKVRDVDRPQLERGSVLIRASAIGMNFHDVEIRRRGEPGMPVPLIPGTDVAGEIIEIAPDVTDLTVGQRVLALVRNAGYAELVKAHASLTTPIPDGVTDVMAASVPVPGLTAWLLCRDFIPSSTDYVVVHSAAGALGCWIASILRARSLSTIAIVSSAAKAEVATAAGYSRVINSTESPNVLNDVLAATRRRGADVVLDSAAGEQFARSFRMLRPGGTVVLLGRAGGAPSLVGLDEYFLDARRNLTLTTFFLSRALLTELGSVRSGFAELFAIIERGELTLPVTELPLEQAAHAQDLMESRRNIGRLVLRP